MSADASPAQRRLPPAGVALAAVLLMAAPAAAQDPARPEQPEQPQQSQAGEAPAVQPRPAQAQGSGPRIDPQRAFLDQNRRQPGWMVSGTGLQYRPVKRVAPDAPQPDGDDTVRVHYEGRYIDGTVFDSSYARGEPASFPLHGLIRGWQEGIPMMRVGEVWEFVVPYQLGYGAVGRGPIPGGATLLFKVELLGFEAGTAPKNEGKAVNPEAEKRRQQKEAEEKKNRNRN